MYVVLIYSAMVIIRLCEFREFELPGKEVIIHREGFCLIIEPVVKKNNLSTLLAGWSSMKEDFPVIKELPLDDIDDL